MRWYRREWVHVLGVLLALLAAHLLTAVPTEPFFNNDESRHTMTGVFFADAIRDLPAPAADPKGYAERYYCQYPALGIVSWPPLFYAVEGLAVLLFGPHFLVGRLCVAAFAAVAVVYTYRFARPMLNHPLALLVAFWVGLSPKAFELSQHVMLEVPTLAFVLAALVHFERYLTGQRGRDVILAGLFAACAVLTRFDGVLLLIYFGIRLVGTGGWRLLGRRAVLLGVSFAALLAGPYYALTAWVYGSGMTTAAVSGTGPEDAGFQLSNLWFYPGCLSTQAGWGLAVGGGAGLLLTLACHRKQFGPAFALLLAVYGLFTPLAQLDMRHTVYWLPAVAVCAARPVQWLWEMRWRWAAVGLAAVVTLGTGWEACTQQFRFVFGYDDAARWVIDHRTTDRPVLVDGEYTGSLVYHTRLHDPARRVWVLRGDKLLYAMFSDPATGYRQYAATEAEVLELLEQWDPEFVVVEDPPPTFHRVEGSELLRQTLRANPEKYEVAERVPVRSNYNRLTQPGVMLVIYRKRHRNPAATNDIRMELVGAGRTVGTTRP